MQKKTNWIALRRTHQVLRSGPKLAIKMPERFVEKAIATQQAATRNQHENRIRV
jgi:hypothetical protein